MKKLLLCLISFMLILSACESATSIPSEPYLGAEPTQYEELVVTNGGNSESEQSLNQSEPKEIATPAQVSNGIFDIGSTIFPDQDVYIWPRALNGNRLLVMCTISDESVIYKGLP